VNAYHAVLYVHLLSLLVGVGTASVMTVCAFRLSAARTLAEALPWATVEKNAPKAFPVATLGLFGSGAYLTSDLWTWGTSWIVLSIVGLAVVALQGPLVGGRTGAALGKAFAANGPGELGAAARRAIDAPARWALHFANPFLILAVAWNMTQKPGWGGGVAALVVAETAGIALGVLVARRPRLEATAAEGTV
jgi:hypothetical protein